MTQHVDALVAAPAGDGERAPAPVRPVVVGLGASAGGLRVLKAFFGTVPADTGLAFVVVMHLSPDHESHLADLLQVDAAIPVSQVTGEVPLEPDRVYVIPPGTNLTAVDSHLRLAPLAQARLARAPVDHFFRTLAETHDGGSIGVVLSGTGTDGTAGIRYIRDHGGLVVAQDPDEAEYDGMPRSAIATGSVDRVLPVSAMMSHILEFAHAHGRLRGTGEAGADDSRAGPGAGDLLETVLTLLRLRTGHDFTRYKRSTVARRVARRMQVLSLATLPEYVEVVRQDAKEAAALLDDLLINVTSFFRDPDVFRALESSVIPSLFDGKGRGDTVRVWSVGCATGEEAYTLGILLLEEASRRTSAPQIQIFATDLHEPSLQHARAALYSDMVTTEIPRERLERFFRRESEGYRVTKELRDIVVFASHNLLRDPPFSRQDLILCRNVMIYLQRDVQEEVVEIFHYALRPGGRLLLGSAESLDRTELFSVENKVAHLYRRRDGHRGTLRVHDASSASHPRLPRAAELPAHGPSPVDGFDAVHQRLLERLGPPSLLVGNGQEVVHLSASVGRYLQHPRGEPTSDLFKLVREEFRLELRAGLQALRERGTPWRSRPIAARIDGVERLVTLRAGAANEAQFEGLTLVYFDESDADVSSPAPGTAEPDRRILEVEAELDTTRSRMQVLIEDSEASHEEMRAANEELQSANEELRSTMEELETSREELQSVNEELQTLNQENRHRVEELGQLSNDLQNLLQATDIATIFLDRSLRILRYTPRVSEIFNVRPTDRGRPLADLTHRLGYQHLLDDARAVLQTLVPVEREVAGPSVGSWFSLRIAPYRTMDDRIDGVVISVIDMTALKQTELALRKTQEREGLLLRVQDAIQGLNDPLEIQREASRLLGEHLRVDRVGYSEIDGDHVVFRAAYLQEVDPASLSSPVAMPNAAVRAAQARGESVVVDEVDADGRFTDAERGAFRAAQIASFASVAVAKQGDSTKAFTVQSRAPRAWQRDEVALVRDVGTRTWERAERARASEALEESEERFRLTVEGASSYAIFGFDGDGRIESWSPGAESVFGWTAAEMVGQSWELAFTPEDRAAGQPQLELDLARRNGSAPDCRWHQRRDGSRVFIDGSTHRLPHGTGGERFVKIGQDVTMQRKWEQALRELNETLEARVADRTGELSRANVARDVLRLQLVQAEEQERARLARELHDEVGQHLTALGLGLHALSDVAQPGSEVDRRTTQLKELVGSLSQEMHALAVRLRPKALDDFGLEVALTAYVDAWSQRSGIAVDLHAAIDGERLSPAVESAVYRVVQEALTNVAKHSRATRASVAVEQRDGQVVAIIEDNGRGFPTPAGDEKVPSGLGLLGIQERAALLGGMAQVESTLGSGTTVFVRIPIERAPSAPPEQNARPRDAAIPDV